MHLLQKDSVLRGSMNVIDLNSGVPAYVPAELFSKEMPVRGGLKGSVTMSFLLFYENSLP